MKTFYSMVCILIVTTLNLIPKDNNMEDLPKLLGVSNAGREFYFSFIPCWETPNAGNDLKIYISSNVETLVTVEVPGKAYIKQKKTIPNDIIEFTLAPAIGQPYRKTDREVPQPDQVWKDAGVHVIADDPIICYGMTRFQYTSDGFLAIPVNTLGKEYIIASFADPSPNTIQWLPSYSAITAAYYKTKIWFTMGGTDWSKTAGGLMPGQTSTWNLNEGDVLLISGLGSHAEITGSKVVASKPVSVVSGNFCAYIPTNCACCDVIEEMELPTNMWGTEYHVTPIANRLKNSIIKVFAKEAKTKIYRDHVQIGFLRDAGGTEQNGYLHMRSDEGKVRPVLIGGDKPISVTQFNCGQQDDNIVSDPFQMVLLPIEQYDTITIFCTPGIRGGIGFAYNYLNLCYQSDSSAVPEDLELAQVTAGSFTWTKIKTLYPDTGAAFSQSMGSKNYYNKTLLLPGEGVYKVRAAKPFQAYLYGFSSYDSYGMPASASLKPLPVEDTLAPHPVWILDCDGTVNLYPAGYVTDKPNDPEVRSNLSTIYMDKNESYNYKLYHSDFMPCEDEVVAWRLEIIDNSEDARAVVTFADCAGNDTTIYVQYTAVKLTIVPKTWDYHLRIVGQTTDKMYYVVNQSETSPALLNFLKLKKGEQGFSIWDSTGTNRLQTDFFPGIMIAPLDSFPFIVRFEAAKTGEFWDSIGIGDTCNFWYKAYGTANGGAPIIDVTDWSFPLTTVDSSSLGQIDIKNIGSYTLEIYDYKGPFITAGVGGRNIFESQELANQNISDSTPLILPPMEVRTFQIKFTPDAESGYTDSIVFISNTIKDEQYNFGNPIDSICMLVGTGTLVDVNEFDANRNFTIIPNPASDNLIITSDKTITDIKIFDILGCERQCPLSIGEDRTVVNTSELNDGIYFLKISAEEKIIIMKFIVRK